MKSEISDSRKSSSTGNIFRLNTPGFCQDDNAKNVRDISVDAGCAEAEQLFKQSSALSGLFFLLFDFSRPVKIILSLTFAAVMVGGLLKHLSSNEYSFLNFDNPNSEVELVNLAALMAPAIGGETLLGPTAGESVDAIHASRPTDARFVDSPALTSFSVVSEAKPLSNDDMGFQMVVAADLANHQYILELPLAQEDIAAIKDPEKNSAIESVSIDAGPTADKPKTKSSAISESQALASAPPSAPAIQINENQVNVERKLIERSKQLVRQGRLSQAQIELGAGLVRLPESALVLLELNRLFIKSSRWTAAGELLAANSWLPKTALAQGTAELLYAQGEYTRAMSELTGFSPDVIGNESFYLLKASVLRKLKKFSAAEVIYQQLLTHEPRKGSYWLGLAVCQDFAADPAALNSYRQALKFNRAYPKVVTYIRGRMKVLNVFRSKTVIAKQGF